MYLYTFIITNTRFTILRTHAAEERGEPDVDHVNIF